MDTTKKNSNHFDSNSKENDFTGENASKTPTKKNNATPFVTTTLDTTNISRKLYFKPAEEDAHHLPTNHLSNKFTKARRYKHTYFDSSGCIIEAIQGPTEQKKRKPRVSHPQKKKRYINKPRVSHPQKKKRYINKRS